MSRKNGFLQQWPVYTFILLKPIDLEGTYSYDLRYSVVRLSVLCRNQTSERGLNSTKLQLN